MYLVFCLCLFAIGSFAQTKDSTKTIVLDEVIIYPLKSKIIEAKISKEVRASCKGFSSIISYVPPIKNIHHITGIEFFFNHKYSASANKGFYLRPIIVQAENMYPSNKPFFRGYDYFVTQSVGQRVFCSFNENPISVEEISDFFIGVEFIEKQGSSPFEDFNITLGTTNKPNLSYTKGVSSNCKYTPLNVDKKNGLILKYRLFYD